MNMPSLGFGTFRLSNDVAYKAVTDAINLGYRHIDTAQAYSNEADVGRAIADSSVSRRDIYLTTKVWNDNLTETNFLKSVQQSLENLHTDYVDLLLIHWPSPPDGVSLEHCVEWLLEAKERGFTRQIGVSNFTISQLEQIKSVVPLEELVTNQVEVHPYLQNKRLRDYCKNNKLGVTGYMPFAVGKVLCDAVVTKIANECGRTPAEVVIAWSQARGISVIPSSTKPDNMRLNAQGATLTLAATQLAAIDELDCNDRQANPPFAPAWD